MWPARDEVSPDGPSDAEGEDVQKLSVISSLPSLLENNQQECIAKLIPRMQENLLTATTEFQLAASATFKNIIEQNLVGCTVFTRIFLQTILNAIESQNPAIVNAWIGTLFEAIDYLPVEIIREEILPRAVNKGQLVQTTGSRVVCCGLMGKICTRFDSILIKKEVLPTIHSLCQDVSSTVRACICRKLHHVAKNLDPETIMSSLLPFFIELVNDEESSVRCASVQTIVDLLPHLEEETRKNTIIPLAKKIFENALKSDDNVIITVSRIFGSFALEISKSLNKSDYNWFLQYYQQLCQLGLSCREKDLKQDFCTFNEKNPSIVEKFVECRHNCATNLATMFRFASLYGDVNVLLPTLSALTNDHNYLIKRDIASDIHEIANLLGPRSGLIKSDIIRLLKCEAKEVKHSLIPHLSEILLLLVVSKTIGTEQIDSTGTEIGKVLIECESEISRSNNWRLSELILDQFQVLPKCFPSDYIYSYFVPLTMERIFKARPIPVRLAAGRTILHFLRYNFKSLQRTELRTKINGELAQSQNFYTRMLYIRIMNEALELFSSFYFKKYFFLTLIGMTADPVANIRLKVITMYPTLKRMLRLPADKKLLVTLESNFRHVKNSEKDKDVINAVLEVSKKLGEIESKGQMKSQNIGVLGEEEDLRKYEEEMKLETIVNGMPNKKATRVIKAGTKSTNLGEDSSMVQLSTKNRETTSIGSEIPKPSGSLNSSSPTKSKLDPTKTSTSSNSLTSNWARLASNSMFLEHPWEKAESSFSQKPPIKFSYPSKAQNSSFNNQTKSVFKSRTYPLKKTCQDQKRLSCSCLNYSDYSESKKFNYQSDINCPFTLPFPLHSNQDKYELMQDFLLTRDESGGGGGDDGGKSSDLTSLQAFEAAHYLRSSFSSLPELPMIIIDDDFIVDTGIRIPSQLSASQSTSKTIDAKENVYRNKVRLNNDRLRRYSTNSTQDLQREREESRIQEYRKQTCSALSAGGSSDYKNKSRRSWHIDNNYHQFDSNHDSVRRNNSSVIISRNKSTRAPPSRRCSTHFVSLSDSRDDKIDDKHNFKRHSIQLSRENSPTFVERQAMTMRTFSSFDVNHNQGQSKIPLRSFQSGSRTAPASRTSSPARGDLRLFFQNGESQQIRAQSSQERNLGSKFSNSEEEVEKLCEKLLYSQGSSSGRISSPRGRDSRLPIRLQREK